NNSTFLANQGFTYASTEPHHLAHHDLARAFLTGGDEKSISDLPVVKGLKSHRPGDPHLIVSSEAFQNVRPAALVDIVGRDAIVVAYIREQLEYLVSAYLQRVQASALCLPLSDYMRRAFRTVNYSRFVAQWEQVFSTDSLRVRVFDRSHLLDNDIVADFLSVVGIEARPENAQAAESNPSLTYPLLLLKRASNRNIAAKPFQLGHAFLAFDEWAARIGGKGMKTPVAPALAEQVREMFAPSNARLAERRFGRKELFQIRPLPSQEHVPDAEIEAIMAHFPALSTRARRLLSDLIRGTAHATKVDETEADVICRMAAHL
ncbi:MAG: hypothetical protein EBZ36_18605, partial [Acidobacteria bacterium]|nr:hypothetical protein [Acidobacteriota bacterium]